jgi:hypothetical protein
MSNDNARLSEKIIPVTFLEPITGAQASVNSTWVNMDDLRQVLAVINIGVAGTSVDFKLQQATDSSGTGAKDITGKAITQVTSDDAICMIECSAWELDTANSFTHVSMDVTTVGATAACAAIMYSGPRERYIPGTSIADETIVQTIS